MKIFALSFLCFFAFAVWGCSEDNPTRPKPVVSFDSVTYEISALGIQEMRAGEYLVIWVKIAPDTTWRFVSTVSIRFRYPDDTVVLVGKFFWDKPIDSIRNVLITLERTSQPISPGLLIAQSTQFVLDSAKIHTTCTFDSKLIIGDNSSLRGGLVFTSSLPDPTAFTHEFYMMNMQGSVQTPSLLSLSALPVGWKYGLWAVDTTFTPHQYFLYGLFTSAQGYDSDSLNDHYPYPGGWKPQAMDVPSGQIVMTLEPDLYGDSLRYKGPSAFRLLNFKRIRDIEKNKNYPMVNVSASYIPSGWITLKKG